MVCDLHLNADGSKVVLCSVEERTLEPAEAGIVFTSYADQTLGFGISHPLGWVPGPGGSENEVLLRPADQDPTRGMAVMDLGESSGDMIELLDNYQADLFAEDPSVARDGEVELIGGGWSQRLSRQIDETMVIERATFFPTGYRVRQRAPAGEWPTWDDAYLQMLASLVVGLGEAAP